MKLAAPVRVFAAALPVIPMPRSTTAAEASTFTAPVPRTVTASTLVVALSVSVAATLLVSWRGSKPVLSSWPICAFAPCSERPRRNRCGAGGGKPAEVVDLRARDVVEAQIVRAPEQVDRAADEGVVSYQQDVGGGPGADRRLRVEILTGGSFCKRCHGRAPLERLRLRAQCAKDERIGMKGERRPRAKHAARRLADVDCVAWSA